MKKYLFLLLFLPLLVFPDEWTPKNANYIETDTLSAVASTAADSSTEVYVGRWQGAITLAVAPDTLSGTAQDITVTLTYRMTNFNNAEYVSLGTITAAQITSGQDVYFNITSALTNMWIDYVKVKFSGASGTYSVKLRYQIKGQ